MDKCKAKYKDHVFEFDISANKLKALISFETCHIVDSSGADIIKCQECGLRPFGECSQMIKDLEIIEEAAPVEVKTVGADLFATIPHKTPEEACLEELERRIEQLDKIKINCNKELDDLNRHMLCLIDAKSALKRLEGFK